MRLLPILCFLLASACCFSVDKDHIPPDEKPLRGKELWKTVSDMSSDDIDEVARIIAENREEAGERVRRQHSELHKKNSFAIEQAKKYVEELKKYMRPSSEDLPPSITEINMRSGLDEVLVEGDIIMTPEQARHYFHVDSEGRRSKRQAYQNKHSFPKSLWSNGVYYMFDKNLNQKARAAIDEAVAFWQANTCINFTKTDDPKNAPIKPVINFFPGNGCNSPMGRQLNRGTQTVNIGSGCEFVSHNETVLLRN
uniref:Astacin domain-containing protein n=1 Tax=Steinernema glaseri TaxID=37863 RepID=A0A1I7ZW90_9BILA